MRALLAPWILLAALVGAIAPSTAFVGGPGFNMGLLKPFSSDDPMTTAFLARTSGLTTPQTEAYRAFINDQHATLAKLDGFWFGKSKDKATASLNLVQDAFNLVEVGSTILTPDTDWKSDGTSGYLRTGIVPGGSNKFQQNDACMGIVVTSKGALYYNPMIGTWDGSNNNYSAISTSPDSDVFGFYLNSSSDDQFNLGHGFEVTKHWTGVRTSSTAIEAFREGVSIGTTSKASTPIVSAGEFYLMSWNVAGGPNSTYWDGGFVAAYIGSHLSAAEIASLHAAINTFRGAF